MLLSALTTIEVPNGLAPPTADRADGGRAARRQPLRPGPATAPVVRCGRGVGGRRRAADAGRRPDRRRDFSPPALRRRWAPTNRDPRRHWRRWNRRRRRTMAVFRPSVSPASSTSFALARHRADRRRRRVHTAGLDHAVHGIGKNSTCSCARHTPEEFAASGRRSRAPSTVECHRRVRSPPYPGVRPARQPRAALQDPRRPDGGPGVRLDPADDLLHPPEAVPVQRAATTTSSARTGLGGWCGWATGPRGATPARSACTCPAGGSGSSSSARRSRAVAHDAGGLRFEVVEPFVEHRV
jgi:hypothetical protein